MLDENNKTHEQLANSLTDFLDNSLCGYITTDATGVILYANKRIFGWLQVPENEIQGRRFSDLLSTGGRIYYETHLAPLLRMQGFYDEVALELKDISGTNIPVFINAYERLDDKGNPIFIRIQYLELQTGGNLNKICRPKKNYWHRKYLINVTL